MFSNSSSSGGGCGCGTGGNDATGIWSSSGLKKQQKRPKVPKRGPGVAELEKILREQEKTDHRGNVAEGFPSSCFIPHHSNPHNSPPSKPYRSSPPPSRPPMSLSPPVTMTSRRMSTIRQTPASTSPAYIPLAPKFDLLNPATPPTVAALYGNGGYNTVLGTRNGSASTVGGSGLVFPEQAFFPMNPSSCKSYIEGRDGTKSDAGNSSSKNLSTESNSNPLWSCPALAPQKRHNQYPPSMMKQFLGPAEGPTSSSSSPTGVLHTHVEPPSNQSSYYNCISRTPEEQKMVGMKRPHPSSFDNSLVPPTPFHVPIFSNFNRPNKSFANGNHSASSFTSSNNESYRDAKWANPMGFNSRKFKYSDINGGPDQENFPSFNGVAAVPSPPMHMFHRELCKCNVLPYQVTKDRMEDTYQRPESSSGSDHRPFYNFSEVKEVGMREKTLGSNHEGCDAGSDGIDLSLKL